MDNKLENKNPFKDSPHKKDNKCYLKKEIILNKEYINHHEINKIREKNFPITYTPTKKDLFFSS